MLLLATLMEQKEATETAAMETARSVQAMLETASMKIIPCGFGVCLGRLIRSWGLAELSAAGGGAVHARHTEPLGPADTTAGPHAGGGPWSSSRAVPTALWDAWARQRLNGKVCWARLSESGSWWPSVVFADWAALRRWGLPLPARLPSVPPRHLCVYFLGPSSTYGIVRLCEARVQPLHNGAMPVFRSRPGGGSRQHQALTAAVDEALELLGEDAAEDRAGGAVGEGSAAGAGSESGVGARRGSNGRRRIDDGAMALAAEAEAAAADAETSAAEAEASMTVCIKSKWLQCGAYPPPPLVVPPSVLHGR
jgi:hypothetical protein